MTLAAGQCNDPVTGPTTATLLDGASATQIRVSLSDADPVNNPTGEIQSPSPTLKNCSYPEVSKDGSVLVFTSPANQFMPGGTNPSPFRHQLYVRDLATGVLKLVSGQNKDANGRKDPPADGQSTMSKVSPDGRYVVFQTRSSSLPGDTTVGVRDIYLFDRTDDELLKVTVNPDTGEEGKGNSDGQVGISDGGQYVVFASRSNNLVTEDPKNPAGLPPTCGIRPSGSVRNVFVFDRGAPGLSLVNPPPAAMRWVTVGRQYFYDQNGDPAGVWGCTQPDGDSLNPCFSSGGCFVAFESDATNLVFPPVTNGRTQVYVWERTSETIELVSVAPNGQPGDGASTDPAISADGRYVAFTSSAANLLPLGVDTNSASDIFVFDRVNKTTARVSVTDDGVQWSGFYTGTKNPGISGNGRFVGFVGRVDPKVASVPLPLPRVEVILHDRDADNDQIWDEHTTAEIGTVYASRLPGSNPPAPANGQSGDPCVFTEDGQWVFFASDASDLDGVDTLGGPQDRNIVQREVCLR